MRGLKIGAIAAVSLLLVMVLLVGYLFLTAEVVVSNISSVGVSPDETAFEQIQASVEDGTFIGTLYQKPLEWKNAEDYVLLTYTLRIRNDCLVPIDMIEAQVVPQSTDILQLGDLAVHSLNMKSEGDLSVSILAPKDTHPVREIVVTYYVWGVGFSLKATYGG